MELNRLSDAEVIELLKVTGGERFDLAFCELVRRYKNAIVTFLTRYTGDAKTAEDLSQEAFVRVYRKIADYDSRAKFSTWLYTIASNLAKDEFKRKRRHPAMSYDWQSSATDDTTRGIPMTGDERENPEAVALETETSERVQETLKKLEELDREVLVLREIQGLKYEEIAQALALPLGTVKSRIARARIAFKQVWERDAS